MNVSKAIIALMLAGAFGAGSLAVLVVRPANTVAPLAAQCSGASSLEGGNQLERAPVRNSPGKDY